MQAIDEKIVIFFQSIRREPLTQFFNIFIPLEFWIFAAGVIVLFFFIRTKTLRVPVISFFLARSLSEYSYRLIKGFVHRPRPFLTIKEAVPLMSPSGFSFPSGHATIAMATAVVLAYHFPKTRVSVYILAVLAGFSRIYFGVHYLSDVLAGFVLGYILGWLSILLERLIISFTKGARLGKQNG